MATIVQKVKETLHSIKAWLYPNNLKDVDGKFVAKAEAEAPLSVEDVSADAISRGDVTGNYDDMVRYVHGFLDQMVHQLLDGFSVNLGYFSIHPGISGTFDSANETFSKEKHQFNLSFRICNKLRKLINSTVTVVIQGIAAVEGYIDRIFDVESDTTDEVLTKGFNIHIFGYKLRIAGLDPSVGVYFVDALTGMRFKALNNLDINNPSMLSVRVPDNLPDGDYYIEIITQFTQGKILLDKPRTIRYDVKLTASGGGF